MAAAKFRRCGVPCLSGFWTAASGNWTSPEWTSTMAATRPASKLTLLAALALPMAARGDAPLTAGCRPNYPENPCWESSPLKTRFGSFEYM